MGPQARTGDHAARRGAAVPLTDLPASAAPEIERAFRENHGRAVAVLVRLLGDIDAAEEAVQDAFLTAVQRWPEDGVPPSPAGWIVTTARNRAIDRLRRESTRADRSRSLTVRCVSNSPSTFGGLVRCPALFMGWVLLFARVCADGGPAPRQARHWRRARRAKRRAPMGAAQG